MGSRFSHAKGQFWEGKVVAHWKVSAMSCAKTAEPITTPFVMWTRVSPRKHALDGGAHWCINVWQWYGLLSITLTTCLLLLFLSVTGFVTSSWWGRRFTEFCIYEYFWHDFGDISWRHCAWTNRQTGTCQICQGFHRAGGNCFYFCFTLKLWIW